jgi:hypothetical protein
MKILLLATAALKQRAGAKSQVWRSILPSVLHKLLRKTRKRWQASYAGLLFEMLADVSRVGPLADFNG